MDEPRVESAANPAIYLRKYKMTKIHENYCLTSNEHELNRITNHPACTKIKQKRKYETIGIQKNLVVPKNERERTGKRPPDEKRMETNLRNDTKQNKKKQKKKGIFNTAYL